MALPFGGITSMQQQQLPFQLASIGNMPSSVPLFNAYKSIYPRAFPEDVISQGYGRPYESRELALLQNRTDLPDGQSVLPQQFLNVVEDMKKRRNAQEARSDFNEGFVKYYKGADGRFYGDYDRQKVAVFGRGARPQAIAQMPVIDLAHVGNSQFSEIKKRPAVISNLQIKLQRQRLARRGPVVMRSANSAYWSKYSYDKIKLHHGKESRGGGIFDLVKGTVGNLIGFLKPSSILNAVTSGFKSDTGKTFLSEAAKTAGATASDFLLDKINVVGNKVGIRPDLLNASTNFARDQTKEYLKAQGYDNVLINSVLEAKTTTPVENKKISLVANENLPEEKTSKPFASKPARPIKRAYDPFLGEGLKRKRRKVYKNRWFD